MSLDINAPVARIEGVMVVEWEPVLPDWWNNRTNYRSAGDAIWAADGWRQLQLAAIPEGHRVVSRSYEIVGDVVVERVTTEPIPETYPQPDVTVPVVDANGNPVGTARLLVDAAGQLVIVADSASPQRPWPDQKADAVARIAAAKTRAESARAAGLAAAASAQNYITFDLMNGAAVATNAWSYSATGTAVIVGSATYSFNASADATTTWYVWRDGFATNSPDKRCANILFKRAVPAGTTSASYQFSETFPVLSTAEVFRMTVLPAVAMTNSYRQDNAISRNYYFELTTYIME